MWLLPKNTCSSRAKRGKLAANWLINQLTVVVHIRKTHIPAVLSGIGHISRIGSFFNVAAHFTISVRGEQGTCSHHQTQTVVKCVSLLRTIFCEVAVAEYVVAHNILNLGRFDSIFGHSWGKRYMSWHWKAFKQQEIHLLGRNKTKMKNINHF